MKNIKHKITIEELDRGYVVFVGCKKIAFEQWESLEKELTAYATGKETELFKEMMKDVIVDTGANIGEFGPVKFRKEDSRI